MGAEVASAVDGYPHVMFFPTEPWILNSLTETYLRFQDPSRLLIQSLTLILRRVTFCWEWTWMELAEYCLCCAGPFQNCYITFPSLIHKGDWLQRLVTRISLFYQSVSWFYCNIWTFSAQISQLLIKGCFKYVCEQTSHLETGSLSQLLHLWNLLSS